MVELSKERIKESFRWTNLVNDIGTPLGQARQLVEQGFYMEAAGPLRRAIDQLSAYRSLAQEIPTFNEPSYQSFMDESQREIEELSEQLNRRTR